MKKLKAMLPQESVIVGQNIAKDVEWLGLREGENFAAMVDLAALLRVWNGERLFSSWDNYLLYKNIIFRQISRVHVFRSAPWRTMLARARNDGHVAAQRHRRRAQVDASL